MPRFRLFIMTVVLGTISAAFAACGPASSTAIPRSVSADTLRSPDGDAYRTLYRFKPIHDRTYGPNGQLTGINGELYGTTDFGGRHDFGTDSGTVFSLTPSGVLHFLYRFKGGPDGDNPNGGLTDVGDRLYGTTYSGGDRCFNGSQRVGCGTLFSITTSGDERTIYRFKGGADGFMPNGGLTWLDGKLYGTTLGGGGSCSIGAAGCGTVFSVDKAGHERVLYRFQTFRDGLAPNGSLLAFDGKLYGTSSAGGDTHCYDGCGTLFEITTAGAETVLHRFHGDHDGADPNGGLIAQNGSLYGTTSGSGSTACAGERTGRGTVFEATPSGDVSVIYRFKGTPDSAAPYGDLVADRGTLYGT